MRLLDISFEFDWYSLAFIASDAVPTHLYLMQYNSIFKQMGVGGGGGGDGGGDGCKKNVSKNIFLGKSAL